MRRLLSEGLRIKLNNSTAGFGRVRELLGAGSQGEVYRVDFGRQSMAVKWYYPEYLARDRDLIDRITKVIAKGAPSDRFLWPQDTVSAPGVSGFGYLMPLREKRFRSLVDLMRRRIEPDPGFRILITAGFELAHNFYELHSRGFCYRDISFGNAFFDPQTGEIRICDNDNVDVAGKQGFIEGTPRFMAPEIVCGEAMPSIETDLYSLAVLLFYLFMMHHPLEGQREAEIHCLDMPAMRRLYGYQALFIFDPLDCSNRPLPGYHDNALAFWPIYPQWFRNLFIRSFGPGIKDPGRQRVRISEWRQALAALQVAVIYCPACAAENFFDQESGPQLRASLEKCWSCGKKLRLPMFLRIDNRYLPLNHNSVFHPHHLNPEMQYDYSRPPLAEVTCTKDQPQIWGLRNLGEEKWVVHGGKGIKHEVKTGLSATLKAGIRIHFGKKHGEVLTSV